MDIRRRRFLGTAVAGTAGALVATNFPAQAFARSIDTDPVATVSLGKELKVSRIGIGTGMRGGGRSNALLRRGDEHHDRVIRRAYDAGVRLFDLADMYGSHLPVTRALEGKPRDSYALVTKIWFRAGGIPEPERPNADVVIERFLKELKTDYIDLVQLHCTTSPEWTAELKEQMEIMDGLKQKGLIRAHGTSCHSIGALSAAAEDAWVDVVHTRINPEGEKMDGPPDKVVPVIRKIHDAGKGVIGMKIIGEGAFRGSDQRRDESVKFVLGLGCVDAMIVGFEEEWEIDDFLRRVERALKAQAAG